MAALKKFSINGPVTVVFLTILVGSLTLNLLLGQRVRSLNSRIGRQQEAIANLRSELQLKVGSKVPDINGLATDGQPMQIVYSSDPRPVVLYLMRPSCIWCQRNSKNINWLASHLSSEFRFVGLTLAEEELFQDFPSSKLNFPVVTKIDPQVVERYKLGGTPRTIVVDKEAIVQKNWSGAYTGAVEDDIEGFFQVELPGLTPESALDSTP